MQLDDQALQEILDKSFGDIDAYYSELNQLAQGRHDLVAKWIKRTFELNLGTDDAARAEFMAKVANTDEERAGRIPYDYEKYSSRSLEDYKLGTEGIDRVKKRLQDDYDTTVAGKQIEWGESRQNQNESLIADRLLNGTRENAIQQGGIAGQRAAKLETAITQERTALDTEQARALEDVEVERRQLDLQQQRDQQDIKDKYRRQAVDELYNRDKNTEENDLSLEQEKKTNELNAGQAKKTAEDNVEASRLL